MTDIVERLRALEAWIRKPTGEPFNMNTDLFDDAAAEIERLRAGGCARDQGTTQYCAEAAKLAAEVERLRAALREIAEYEIEEGCPCNACEHSEIARAALAKMEESK